MRLEAMGAPMTPRPTNPMVSGIALLSGLSAGGALLTRQPAQARLGVPVRGLVLEADESVVARGLDALEDEVEVQLAGAGLVAARGVGDLDVRDVGEVLLERRHQVPLHALQVVEVELEADVLALYGADELQRLGRAREQVWTVLDRVD